jgi:hypothetical protein
VLEALLPESGWVLGVDEHTALVLDLEAGTAEVTGRGAVTVRRGGTARRFPAGAPFRVETLLAAAHETVAHGRGPAVAVGAGGAGPAGAHGATSPPGAPGVDPASTGHGSPSGARPLSPLLQEVTRHEQAFDAAFAARQATRAAEAILALDRTIADWADDTLQSDEPDRARAVLHALVHRLGEAAAGGLRDPRETVGPLVEAMLSLRAELRGRHAWDLADLLRARLLAAGIEVHDTPEGSTWELR